MIPHGIIELPYFSFGIKLYYMKGFALWVIGLPGIAKSIRELITNL